MKQSHAEKNAESSAWFVRQTWEEGFILCLIKDAILFSLPLLFLSNDSGTAMEKVHAN
jgi:hypothetical protein